MRKISLPNLDFLSIPSGLRQLITGGVAGSVVYLGTIPLVARMYGPEAIGVFQLLFSIAAPLTVISTLKYEKTIVLSKNDKETKTGIALSWFSLFSILSVLAVGFFLFSDFIFDFLNAESIKSYYPLILLALFLEGVLTISTQHLIKLGAFKKIALSRFFQLSGYGLFPLLCFYFSDSFVSLFVSRVASYLLGLLFLINRAALFSKKTADISSSDIIHLAKENKQLPLFLVPSNFLNNISIELPVFMIASLFGGVEIGLYAMALKIIQLPFSLIEGSVSEVYFKKIAELSEDKKAIFSLFKKTTSKLFLSGLGLLLLLPFVPFLVRFFLGENWVDAGYIACVLYPAVLVSFISTCVSGTFVVLRKQNIAFLLVVLSIVLRYLFMFAFHSSLFELTVSYAVSSVFFYVLYLFVLFILLRPNENSSFKLV